jgi:hypothetical protein
MPAEIEGADPLRELTQDQRRRVAALNCAGTVLTRRQGIAGIASATSPARPGDLVRVAWWILGGELVLEVGEDEILMHDDAGFISIENQTVTVVDAPQ